MGSYFYAYVWSFFYNYGAPLGGPSGRRSSAFNGLAPFYLKELINLKEPCKYKLRSDCDGLLLNTVKFKTLTTLGDRSFAVAAPQLWNSLPYAIRSSPSVASFKQTLKTFLFQKAFL